MGVWGAAAMLVLLAVGCQGDPASLLAVDLRTDLVPGVEYARARTTLDTGAAASLTVESAVARGDDFVTGRRIADYDSPPRGTLRLRVDLLAADGRIVLSRPVRVTYGGGVLGVTVVMTRNCRGVGCPAAGDPTAEACLDGRCVAPECTGTDPTSCAPACADDTGCTDGSTCASARCIGGACLLVGDEGACSPDQYCEPESGCRPAAPTDAGACACDPDLDADGSVTIGDFNLFLACYSAQPGCTDPVRADFDCDGDVDDCDFGIFQCAFVAGAVGDCCATACGSCVGADAGAACTETSAAVCADRGGSYGGDDTVCT